jgi:hypothetical protein
MAMKKLQALVVALGLATGMTSAHAVAPVTCHSVVYTVPTGSHTDVYRLTMCFIGTKLVAQWNDRIGHYDNVQPTAVGVASAME